MRKKFRKSTSIVMTIIMVINIITIGLPIVYATDFEASITTSESWTLILNVMFAGGAFGNEYILHQLECDKWG